MTGNVDFFICLGDLQYLTGLSLISMLFPTLFTARAVSELNRLSSTCSGLRADLINRGKK